MPEIELEKKEKYAFLEDLTNQMIASEKSIHQGTNESELEEKLCDALDVTSQLQNIKPENTEKSDLDELATFYNYFNDYFIRLSDNFNFSLNHNVRLKNKKNIFRNNLYNKIIDLAEFHGYKVVEKKQELKVAKLNLKDKASRLKEDILDKYDEIRYKVNNSRIPAIAGGLMIVIGIGAGIYACNQAEEIKSSYEPNQININQINSEELIDYAQTQIKLWQSLDRNSTDDHYVFHQGKREFTDLGAQTYERIAVFKELLKNPQNDSLLEAVYGLKNNKGCDSAVTQQSLKEIPHVAYENSKFKRF